MPDAQKWDLFSFFHVFWDFFNKEKYPCLKKCHFPEKGIQSARLATLHALEKDRFVDHHRFFKKKTLLYHCWNTDN